MLRDSSCPVDEPGAPADHQVDAAWLRFVRVAFGTVAGISILRLWLTGWFQQLIVAPTHHLRYPGLDWVPVPPGPVLWALSAVALGASVALVVGWRPRVAALAFVFSFGWIETVEATTYLNHYWLMLSLAVLLALAPVPTRRDAGWVPRWVLWAFRSQVGLVYVFAGMAKLHADWLGGRPLDLWLPSRSDLPLIGPVLELPAVAAMASVAGAVFDLSVVPLLLWRRTRPWAYGALIVFHMSTGALLPSIGLFPILMTLMATVFFEPSWPRRLAKRLELPSQRMRSSTPSPRVRIAVSVWLVFQLVVPLRHWLIPGDARWTGEGYRFSWNVVAVEKIGSVSFRVGSDDILVDPGRWFTEPQLRVASAEPDLIVQMARIIADDLGVTPVHADAWASLNGRPAVRLIDPAVDLTALSPTDAGSVVEAPPPGLDW